MTDDFDVTSPRRHARAGEYDLIRKMGAGGFGVVYEARHRATGLPFAVKRIDLSVDDAERYRNEALYPARIASQSLHVLGVHSFFHDPDEDVFYLVTELIAHGDLRAFLDRNPSPLPVAQALDLGIGIAKGLAAIHAQGIIHRDLKPANVLMDLKDDRWVPKIADFGLARSSRSVSIGEFASTGYAAPEQLDLMSDQALGPEADLFSFGMILYELLTGLKPTSARDLREYGRWIGTRRPPPAPSHVRAELAAWPQLDALSSALLEFDRARRMRSAVETLRLLVDGFRQVERNDHPARHDSRPVVARAPEPPPPPRPSGSGAVVSRPRVDAPAAPTVVSQAVPPASAATIQPAVAVAAEVRSDVWTRRRTLLFMAGVFTITGASMTLGLPWTNPGKDAMPIVEPLWSNAPSGMVRASWILLPALFGLALGFAVRLTGAQAFLVSAIGVAVYQAATGTAFLSMATAATGDQSVVEYTFLGTAALTALLAVFATFVFLAPWRKTLGRTVVVTLLSLVVAVAVFYGSVVTFFIAGGACLGGVVGGLGMLVALARWRRPSRRIVALTVAWSLIGGVIFTAGVLSSGTFGKRAAMMIAYASWQLIAGVVLTDRAVFRHVQAVGSWPWKPVLGVTLAAAMCSAAGSWIRSIPEPTRAGATQTNPKNKLVYVWVPPGEFEMGCSPDDSGCGADEQPTRKITWSRGFWLSKTEVSVTAWKAAGTALPPAAEWGGLVYNSGWTDEAMPVANITWQDARSYCTSVDGRLPTEAEWEYAARAGTLGATYGRLGEIAHFADNSGPTPLSTAGLVDQPFRDALAASRHTMQRVGTTRSNAWGLDDMLGNVAEWVEDDYGENTYAVASGPQTNPPPHLTGVARVAKVVRGGSWGSKPADVRVSIRGQQAADARSVFVGVRCVWSGPESKP